MRVQFSDPILVAAATPTTFELLPQTTAVKVAVLFYSTPEAKQADLIAPGTGTRNIAITETVTDGVLSASCGYAGGIPASPTRTGGNATALPDGSFITFSIGPTARISITATAATDATDSESYRLAVIC